MKLYSIRHTQSGKFYDGHGTFYFKGENGDQAKWTLSPSRFWKTPDGVAQGVMRLGCEMVKPPQPPYEMSHTEYCEWLKEVMDYAHRYRCFTNFDPAKLEHIEVIVTNVSVLGEESFPASSFVQDEAFA